MGDQHGCTGCPRDRARLWSLHPSGAADRAQLRAAACLQLRPDALLKLTRKAAAPCLRGLQSGRTVPSAGQRESCTGCLAARRAVTSCSELPWAFSSRSRITSWFDNTFDNKKAFCFLLNTNGKTNFKTCKSILSIGNADVHGQGVLQASPSSCRGPSTLVGDAVSHSWLMRFRTGESRAVQALSKGSSEPEGLTVSTGSSVCFPS